jgi:hypothetical protein
MKKLVVIPGRIVKAIEADRTNLYKVEGEIPVTKEMPYSADGSLIFPSVEALAIGTEVKITVEVA